MKINELIRNTLRRDDLMIPTRVPTILMIPSGTTT